MGVLFERGCFLLLFSCDLSAVTHWERSQWCNLLKSICSCNSSIVIKECCCHRCEREKSGMCVDSIKLEVIIILQHGVVVVVALIINGDIRVYPRHFSLRINLCHQIKLNPSASSFQPIFVFMQDLSDQF